MKTRHYQNYLSYNMQNYRNAHSPDLNAGRNVAPENLSENTDLPTGQFVLAVGLTAADLAIVATYIESPDKLGDPYVAGAATAVIGIAAVKSAVNYVKTLISISGGTNR